MTQTTATLRRPSAGDGPVAVQLSRLAWLGRLRWFYAAAVLLAGLFMTPGRWQIVGLAAGMIVIWQLLAAAIVSLIRRGRISITEAGAGRLCGEVVALDLVLVGLAIWLCGPGLTVLPVLLVLHVAVATSILPSRTAYLTACLGGVLLLAVALAGGSAGAALGQATVMLAALVLTVYFTSAILTRLRKINHRLVESNRQLAGLDLAKSRFLRVSAHQLRSPLAAIHSLLSAVQEAGGFNHRQYELIRKIQAKADDAMALLDEMMLLSTIKENAAETLQLNPVDVDAIALQEASAFAAEAAQKGVDLTVQAGSGACVRAWEDALETVLEHLISNAVKYTPASGSVNVTTASRGGDVEITVADTGIGIPHGEKDRLFHEFFRATNARQVCGGTGMGLAIVHAITDRLGGRLEVESRQESGTTVKVILPAAQQDRSLPALQPDRVLLNKDLKDPDRAVKPSELKAAV